MKLSLSSGCIFEHYGAIPQSVYTPPQVWENPLEKAVYENDIALVEQLLKDGHQSSASLRIGQMSCIEYAAMRGHSKVLQLIIDMSRNASTLGRYFQLEDVADRAYLISKNKTQFFGQDGAMAEINRYEAALFTAVEYNQPECVQLLIHVLGKKEPNKRAFIVNSKTEELSAFELALKRGHKKCTDILRQAVWARPKSS